MDTSNLKEGKLPSGVAGLEGLERPDEQAVLDDVFLSLARVPLVSLEAEGDCDLCDAGLDTGDDVRVAFVAAHVEFYWLPVVTQGLWMWIKNGVIDETWFDLFSQSYNVDPGAPVSLYIRQIHTEC